MASDFGKSVFVHYLEELEKIEKFDVNCLTNPKSGSSISTPVAFMVVINSWALGGDISVVT